MLRGQWAPRGSGDRIALIHAIYGGAWALVSLAAGGGVSPWPAIAILLFAVVLVIGAARQLRRRPQPDQPRELGQWIRRVNLVTALAALLYGWALSANGHEGQAVAAVIVVLGVHFLPMWLLLRRPVLLAIGLALTAVGVATWFWPQNAASGAFLAALILCANAVRLVLKPSSFAKGSEPRSPVTPA